jgi:serine O-acetyltransferase
MGAPMSAPALGPELPALVDRIVASYFADPRTHHIGREYLPSRRAVIGVCEMLLELTYPGYFGRRGLTAHNIAYHVGELLPRVWETLGEQIGACLLHEESGAGDEPQRQASCRRRGADAASRFVERIPDVRGRLALDVQAAYDGDPAATSTAEIILSYPAILAITLYRYAHELYELNVGLIPRIMTEHAHYLTGIDIHPGARIGRSFFIDHGTGVVIGETTVIGDNVRVYQGVTLGALSFPRDAHGRVVRGTKRHPTVGSNVTLYANAIVLGGETRIGDNSVVGGSVFITESVAPGHQVSINPPVLKVRPKGAPRAPVEYTPDWVI